MEFCVFPKKKFTMPLDFLVLVNKEISDTCHYWIPAFKVFIRDSSPKLSSLALKCHQGSNEFDSDIPPANKTVIPL